MKLKHKPSVLKRILLGVVWSVSVVFIAAVSLGTICFFSGIRLNLSSSVPPGFWRLEDLPEEILPGMYVTVDAGWDKVGRERGYVKARSILKRAVGLPGDVIGYDGNLNVNGRVLPNTPIVDHDSQGRNLPTVTFPLIVPEGHFWLMSDHPRGWDCRYLGPVPRVVIQKQAFPILTFEKWFL